MIQKRPLGVGKTVPLGNACQVQHDAGADGAVQGVDPVEAHGLEGDGHSPETFDPF